MKKVAFVSASTRGIGKSIVKELLRKNYTVYANSRGENTLKYTNVHFISADMSKPKQIQKALKQIYKEQGRIDLIVANLGSGKSVSGWDVPLKEYKRIFTLNFFASVSLATSSVKYLQKTQGNIVFISSIAGCENLGAPLAYSSAKTALLSYAKALSQELAKDTIRVNCISPGNVMFKGSTWDTKIKKNKKVVEKYITQNVPLDGFAKPRDIAKAVLFLEKNSFITGTNIVVDGGQLKKII